MTSQLTHHVFNPWRRSRIDDKLIVTNERIWRDPLKWDQAAEAAGERHRVLCQPDIDVFEECPDLAINELRIRLFSLSDRTPNLDWLLPTRQPENIAKVLPPCFPRGIDCSPMTYRPNVWLGVSVEDQATADERIPHLLKVPAAVRVLRCQPLLGPMDFSAIKIDRDIEANVLTGVYRQWCDGDHETPPSAQEFDGGPKIDWVIVGGESGPNARPMHPDWVRSIRDQCQAAGVPFFFTQWGDWLPGCESKHLDLDRLADTMAIKLETPTNYGRDQSDVAAMSVSYSFRVGKNAAGWMLDGREWNELPYVVTQGRKST